MIEQEDFEGIRGFLRDQLIRYQRALPPERQKVSFAEMTEQELAHVGLTACFLYKDQTALADATTEAVYVEFERRGVDRERACALISGLLEFYTHELEGDRQQ